MSENEKHESRSCCCCQSWKAIFIAITFIAIGAAFGHIITMIHMGHCCHMRGPCGDGMRACWDRDGRERECSFERKFRGEDRGEENGWFEHKTDAGKCKPGCTCPMCLKKAGLSEPNKPGCPMMDKKEGKPKKD